MSSSGNSLNCAMMGMSFKDLDCFLYYSLKLPIQTPGSSYGVAMSDCIRPQRLCPSYLSVTY